MKRTLHILLLTLCCFLSAHAQINTDRVMIMGRNALYYEDYVLSIQRFNMVISAKPYWAEPYFYRGVAKFYLEDFLGAEMDCSEAIERNPYQLNHYVLRALCRVNLHRYEEAEVDYNKATSIDPLDAASWHNKVLCQMELKAFERADSALDVMIRQWPKQAENYTIKSQVCFARQDTVNAERWLDRALEINPYEGPAWSLKAMVTLNRGNYKEGEAQLDKAIVQLPRNAGLYINRAMARYNQDNLRGAMTDYDVALEMEPGNYLGHFNRGLLRAQVGDDNRAIEDFDFVLEQEPDNTIALYNRALLYNNTGDYHAAIRDISLVIKDYPEFWEGYTTRAAIRRKIGDVYGAERDEFKVMQARMEKRAGTYKSKGTTRKKSDRNPEDFNKLVEEDTTMVAQEYKSEYRGKVQDKTTQLQPIPMFVLTYIPQEGAMGNQTALHLLVEQINATNRLLYVLKMGTHERVVGNEWMDAFFDDISLVSKHIAKHPERAYLYVRRAMDSYHVRDFDSAIGDLDSYLALDSTIAIGYMMRAQMRCAQLKSGGAEEQLSQTTENRIAYGQALEDLQQVVSLHPNMPYAYYNMGNIYCILRDYDKARECFSQAITLLPQFAAAYYNRGVVNILDNRRDEGLNDLSHAGEYGIYSAYNLIKRYSVKK